MENRIVTFKNRFMMVFFVLVITLMQQIESFISMSRIIKYNRPSYYVLRENVQLFTHDVITHAITCKVACDVDLHHKQTAP